MITIIKKPKIKDSLPVPREGTNIYRVLQRLKDYGSSTGLDFVLEEKILSFNTSIYSLRTKYKIKINCQRVKNSNGKRYGIFSLEKQQKNKHYK